MTSSSIYESTSPSRTNKLPSRCSTKFTPSASGGIILRVCYGYKVSPNDDPFVARAQRALNAMAQTGIHGAYLVDSLPFLKALPSWVPGAGFKREAAEWNPDAALFHKLPVDWVQECIVSGGLV